MEGSIVSVLSKLIFRLRLKLKDTGQVSLSKYEILEAFNEAIRDTRKIVTRFYSKVSFTLPEEKDLLENEESGFPTDFDDLIIERAFIVLSPGDYGAKEQAKSFWEKKVISLAGKFDRSNFMIEGSFIKPDPDYDWYENCE